MMSTIAAKGSRQAAGGADREAGLERISLYRLRIPLVTPYRLAFGVVEAYDTIVVELADARGNRGFGEATILTGYSDETISESWVAAKQFADAARSAAAPIEGALPAFAARFPFAATAFGTALEMLSGAGVLRPCAELIVPLVGLLGAKTEEGLVKEFEEQFASGYRTFKVKVGFDVQQDSARVRLVQRIVDAKALLRLDANQGYTVEQGVSFVKSLDPASIELFEQPCLAADWDAHLAVARESPVPMMLDESIHGAADIERAAELKAAAFIKLKLMKMATIARLEREIGRIKSLGMTPVLGNGVACDLGCWMEACVAARHIDNAGEMNGYLKTGVQLLTGKLQLHRGSLRVERGFAPDLDLSSAQEHVVEALDFSASGAKRAGSAGRGDPA